MPIETIGVVGAGTMGRGIAQVAAQSGFDVLMYDVDEDIVQEARDQITHFVTRAEEKGRIDDAQTVLDRLRTTTSLDDFSPCDAVIEAAPERLSLKRDIFATLEATTGPGTILATNTSTLSVTQIAAETSRPERVVGMHFFNPAPLLLLVEVVAGAQTADDVLEATYELAKQMGKKPVKAKDVPGFIVNRVARPFYLEALRLLEMGITDHATIDKLIKEGGGFRMGPFRLMDLIGIDINYTASVSVFEAYFHEPRYRPSLLQQRQVASGDLGRKSGRGWYSYEEDSE